MTIKHFKTFSRRELLWLHWSGVKSRASRVGSSGPGGASVSVHSSARSRALGWGSNTGPVPSLPHVQGGGRRVCVLSVHLGASLGVHYWGKWWDHCWSLTRVLKTLIGKEFLIALQLLCLGGVTGRVFTGVTAAPSTARAVSRCLTWGSPKLCSMDKSRPANHWPNTSPHFLLSAAVPLALCKPAEIRDVPAR